MVASSRAAQPPVFVAQLESRDVFESTPVKLECDVKGFPQPEITWYQVRNYLIVLPQKFALLPGKQVRSYLITPFKFATFLSNSVMTLGKFFYTYVFLVDLNTERPFKILVIMNFVRCLASIAVLFSDITANVYFFHEFWHEPNILQTFVI